MNAIFLVPGDLDVTSPAWIAENTEVIYELHRLGAEWPAHIMPGTCINPVTGEKLIHATFELDSPDPLASVEGLILTYNLPWEVLGMQSFYCTTPAVYDESDPLNPVLVAPASATVYKPLDPTILDYIQDRYIRDEDGVIAKTLTKDISWLNSYAGQCPW